MDNRDAEEIVLWLKAHAVACVLSAVAIVFVGSLAWTSFHVVGTAEQAVVLRFGEFDSTKGPGIHWKLPFGIDKAIPVPVDRVQKLEFGFRTAGVSESGRSEFTEVSEESQMLTGDENMASVEWTVQYKIKDPKDYLFHVVNPEVALADVSRATMALVVGDCSVTEVLTERRREIALEVGTRLQKTLDSYAAGIDVLTVELENVTPPIPVRDAFNEVNRARQEMETTMNEANKELLKTIPVVEGEALLLEQTAEGYKLKRVNEAQGNVARFKQVLSEYKLAKEVTRKRLYLETVAEILPRLRHIYLIDDKQTGPLKLLDLGRALGGLPVPQGRPGAKTNYPPAREQ